MDRRSAQRFLVNAVIEGIKKGELPASLLTSPSLDRAPEWFQKVYREMQEKT